MGIFSLTLTVMYVVLIPYMVYVGKVVGPRYEARKELDGNEKSSKPDVLLLNLGFIFLILGTVVSMVYIAMYAVTAVGNGHTNQNHLTIIGPTVFFCWGASILIPSLITKGRSKNSGEEK